MLSVLTEKLAEAHGLAIASSTVAAKLVDLIPEPKLVAELEQMQAEADQTRQRCLEVERTFGQELAAEMLAHANSTSKRGADLLGAWFKAGTDPLRAWTFLAMGEAGEVAAWLVVNELAGRHPHDEVCELAAWALPVQQRHLRLALEGTLALAAAVEPAAARWG